MRGLMLLFSVVWIRPAWGNFASNAIGTNGSEFLTLDVGARGMGMAGAYTALTDDAYSLYWNPAGLAEIPKASVALMETQYFAGINYYYAAYAQRVEGWGGTLGGGLRYLDVGNIDHTDINGNTQGTFHPRSFAYELGYGQAITDLSDSEREMSVGGTMRLIHSDILSHASSFAADIGAQAHANTAYFPLRYGLTFQNIGQGQKFDQVRDPLPFRMRLGSVANFTRNFLASAEAVLPISNGPYGAFGTEWMMEPVSNFKAAFRAGLETQSLTNGLNGFRGLDFGLGIAVSDFTFDYAFVPYGVLGNTHRFSISYSFPAKAMGKYRER